MESLGTGARRGGGKAFFALLPFCPFTFLPFYLFALLPFCPFTFLFLCCLFFLYDALTVEHQQGDSDDGEHTHTDV